MVLGIGYFVFFEDEFVVIGDEVWCIGCFFEVGIEKEGFVVIE